uniref:lysozyme n=1 Tax=Scylla paramamosain TaxID=85552 RepID=E1B2R1_SCYPA|nr:lysozyme [Scylla paramamosain]QCC62348.1 c-type lysozyme [Scylla paramamosain]
MRLLVLLLVTCATLVVGKIFTKCELASDLENRYGVAKEDVKKWVCIAQFESTFNTAAINHHNYDHSKDFGLFQLNSRYWCGDKGKNVCKMPCTALLDDDLTNDVQCMKKIIRETEKWKGKGTGLSAWVAYERRCKNMNLDQYIAESSTNADASNTIPVRQVSAGNNPPRQENIPGDYVPIINNARVPIRPKVISNMHPPYMRIPMHGPFIAPSPYHFFYQRNY